MRKFTHISKIQVSLCGKRVVILIPTSKLGYYAFQYDNAFRREGVEIAPLMMPLREEPYYFSDLPLNDYYGLPPVFADSLPDTFGSQLIDTWLQARGFARNTITPLDRLAYLGQRGIGALTYEPAYALERKSASALDLRALVEEAKATLNGELLQEEGVAALRHILRLGASAGGAQAKAVIGWNRQTDTFMLGDGDLPEGFEHWIIKFTPPTCPWRGEMEYAVYCKAKAAGITISESCLYELDGIKHFMTRRFDREGTTRHHLQTLSAMAHYPTSIPLAFRTYERLFQTAEDLRLGYEAKEQLFRRVVFNVAIGECDDHTKNFSFILKQGKDWALAPAYDLTGAGYPSNDPWSAHEGRHQLSVNGKFSQITSEDLLTLAEHFSIGTAPRILAELSHL